MDVICSEANLGKFAKLILFFPIGFGVKLLASALLMDVILVVVRKKGLMGFGGIVICAMVDFNIFFLEFISGAPMNSARSLAPALLFGGMV
jgi:aquaporin Z